MHNANTTKRKPVSKMLCLGLLSMIHFSASAQESTASLDTVFSNPMFIILLSIIILLLIVIIVLANVLEAAAHQKVEQDKKNNGTMTVVKTFLILFTLGGLSKRVFAQDVVSVTQEQSSYWGLDAFTFYLMLTIIGFEILIAYVLYSISMQLLGVAERKRKRVEKKAKQVVKQPSLIEKINASVAIEEEADIMLDHNYDGIRELDNNLPPWWKYGFYFTIIFAVIYLIHYHVTNTGKLQLAEYEDQLTQAKIEMEEYRKKAANLVDENNVTLLTDATSISSGKNIFMDNCAACHGPAGEGGVGPNLTDEYWLHSGSIKDVFKTIKYGWPEKGMKAWQQDLGAKQIHEVSSFIMSLKGTNPPNAKEKQGELYKEAGGDSIKIAITDSTQIVVKEVK